MSWNPVLDKMIEIKHCYMTMFKHIEYEYEGKSCIEEWVEELNIPKYVELIAPLQINQKRALILIRYGQYSDIYSGEEDNTPEDFWDKYDGFYRECRSLVIDIENEEIVLCPFKKFRNMNECEETSEANIRKRMAEAFIIEFSNKLDGSMQSASFYNGEIIMAGSQSLNIDNSWRLADGWRMLNENHNYTDMIKNHPYDTFIFEYISIKDAHVVKYSKEQEGLYLIGIRDKINGAELNYANVITVARRYNIKTTEIYDGANLDNIKAILSTASSADKEGYVINIDGFKVKIKCEDYLRMAHVLSKASSVNLIIKSIADDNYDDMFANVPAVRKDYVTKIANSIFNYVHLMDKSIKQFMFDNYTEDKKEFMISVDKKCPKNIKGYVRSEYLYKPYNVLCEHINTSQPHYKKLNEMDLSLDKIFEGENE